MNLACEEFRRISNYSRRHFLAAGGLGLLGAGIPLSSSYGISSTLPRKYSSSNGFGSAKSCIFLFMWGGPSQLDTFDMKPQAPEEIRGEFKSIATKIPGFRICEHFTEFAKYTDKTALIRSLNHTDPAHLSSGHATVTGHNAPVVNSDRDPPSDRDTPHLGAMTGRLQPPQNKMPASVILPWKTFHPAAPGGVSPGQHGGWLGPKYDPLLVSGDPNHSQWRVPALRLTDGISAERLSSRRALQKILDQQRKMLDHSASSSQWNGYQHDAYNLLTAPQVASAFDLSKEKDQVRSRYGRNIHGQSVLLARRLVEHGVPVVNVNWHNDGKNFWDTHGNNFNRLKKDLIPPSDRALAALLEDLDQRGMLEETIVAWVGEFGRKPQISKGNAGREHWPGCYSGLLAGGGISHGAIYGASDKHAAAPARDPVSPQDYTATIFHALGIDIRQTLHDRDGRPHRVCDGRPLVELFA